MSETTTQHPERRAGQRWRYQYKDTAPIEFELEGRLASDEGWQDAESCVMGLYDTAWTNPDITMTLLSDVPASAPLAADKCKAPEWCDFDDAPDSKDPRIQVYVKAKDGNYGVRRGHRIYCSETCLPPLAAQPAETKRLGCEYSQVCGDGSYLCGHHRLTDEASQPAPQPAPAKPMQLPPQRTDCADCGGPHAAAACPGRPAVPSCMRPGFGYVECDGIINGGLCESHAMLSRMSVGKPARVEGLRRLGHIAGMHDDDLIGGAR